MVIQNEWKEIGKRSRASWSAVAKQLGLRYVRGSRRLAPTIAGRIDGFNVEVTCTDDRAGSATPKTLFKVLYDPIGDPIRIGRATVLTKVGVWRQLIQVADLEIGDAAFDRLALIDAADVESARAFLTEQRRKVISDVLESKSLRDVIVSEAATAFHTRRVETSVQRLTGNILGMVELAKILTAEQVVDGQLALSENLEPMVPLASYFESGGTSNIQDSPQPDKNLAA